MDTIGRPWFRRPQFDPQAEYVAARELTWGSDQHGYRTIAPRAPLDFERLQPPCDEKLAAKLYRTGHIAMVLTEDGEPKARTVQELDSAPLAELPPTSQPEPAKEGVPVAIKRRWGGRWATVDAGGKIVQDGLLRKEAEAILNEREHPAG